MCYYKQTVIYLAYHLQVLLCWLHVVLSSVDDLFISPVYLIVIPIAGFFQTQEESVLCAAGCCAYSLEDKDGIEIKRGKKATLQLNIGSISAALSSPVYVRPLVEPSGGAQAPFPNSGWQSSLHSTLWRKYFFFKYLQKL